MAHIVISFKDGSKKKFDIYKRLTTLGAGTDVDISLDNGNFAALAAYISQGSNGFSIVTPEGKPKARFHNHFISKHDFKDQELGDACLQFFMNDSPQNIKLNDQDVVLAYKRMVEFSERIAQEKDIEALLSTLLREITQITNAEYGLLVLLEDGKPKIKELPNADQLAINTFSDSIINKVIATKEPIIINDALHDHEFSSSLSVINYRLTSVMCVPLTYQGHIIGAIYVGNNSFINAFNKKSLELMIVYASQAALLVQNALHIDALKIRTQKLQESLELSKFGGMIGACPSMQEVFSLVDKISHTDVSVLIMGEVGTGKELVARELHERSARKNGPFLAINCASVADDILESELFGHLRGSFAGATQSRIGKLQSAHNGTIFLDEIDHISPHIQIKLLRSLREQDVVRRGATKAEPVNIRVISATSQDLFALVEKKEFRDDLFYLLNGMQLSIPPLRERGNDVLVIANFLLQKFQKIYGKNIIGFSDDAYNALLNYNWPGNVRQLENRVRRAVVMCDGNRISVLDLDLGAINSHKVLPLAEALEKFRCRYICESLERNANNRTKAAQELGVDPRTIFRYLKKNEPRVC
jgi:transcriptional regulator with GAF, ATPase, and Fis domain